VLTPLHVAARHGLRSFAERLVALPSAAAAARLADFDGQSPSNLARRHGNGIADVIDRLTDQRATPVCNGESRCVFFNK